jgi:NADPH-dependent curcumin reductase CurA
MTDLSGEKNRQWRLARRPTGMVEDDCFEMTVEDVVAPVDGQVLVRNRMLAMEPAMRGWIDDRPNYLPPVQIGEVMRSVAVGEVVESKLDGFEPGDVVTGMTGWQEWALSDFGLTVLESDVSPELALSALGMTGVTAYFGLLEIGRPAEGATVVVSGAAGATGSVVGQIAKIKGCRAIGIAGGPEKCAWLTDTAGFDAAIDYKNDDVEARLAALCPDGVDVFFDNVGGPTLDIVLQHLAMRGAVVVCGSITRYGQEELPPGPQHYFNLTQQRGRMEGFVVLDFLARYNEAIAQLKEWVDAGSIVWEADVQTGFEHAPKTLRRVYTGDNFGKQLLRI